MMKKNILLFVMMLTIHIASAQSIVGLWKTDEIAFKVIGSGTYLWEFKPNGQALQTLDCHGPLPDFPGVELLFTIKYPGLYYIEEGKALTYNFDRNKVDVKINYSLDEKELARSGYPANQIPLVKQALDKMIKDESFYSMTLNEIKSQTKLSAILQILYNDGNHIVFASPQKIWEVRDELFRVSE